MPSKHIDRKTWKIIEDETVRIVKERNKMVKESDVLRILVEEGIKHVKDIKTVKEFTVNG